MKKQKGFYKSRAVHRSVPDRDPEVDIDRIPGLRDALIEALQAAQEQLFLESLGYPVRVEKVVKGERLE